MLALDFRSWTHRQSWPSRHRALPRTQAASTGPICSVSLPELQLTLHDGSVTCSGVFFHVQNDSNNNLVVYAGVMKFFF